MDAMVAEVIHSSNTHGQSIIIAVAEADIPNRGMPPGCSWIGTLVKVYYIGPFDAYITRHPQAEFDVYATTSKTPRRAPTKPSPRD